MTSDERLKETEDMMDLQRRDTEQEAFNWLINRVKELTEAVKQMRSDAIHYVEYDAKRNIIQIADKALTGSKPGDEK